MENKETKNIPEKTDDLYETRLEKLKNLIENGKSPYDQQFERKERVSELLTVTAENLDENRSYSIAGRIKTKRLMGKAGFLDLEDESGRIQLYGAQKLLADDYEIFTTLDLGDILGVTGTLFFTKTGQLSLRIESFVMLSKCLRPLPVVKEADGKVFDAFSDREQRYRMRYVDLLVNPDVRATFEVRSKVVSYIRRFLTERNYLEVETPMMHPIPGGASARPFITHHNTLGMDLYLRVAPELYLKRLLVGGFTKVFEINRNFRNEGISHKHNPEFTMLELYEAYGDMESMLKICEELISGVAEEITGKTVLEYQNDTIDLTPPWRRLSYLDSIKEFAGVTIEPGLELEEARLRARSGGIGDDHLAQCQTIWQVAELLFDEKVEHQLVQPVFITHYPRELSPLAKASPENRDFVDRFEPYMAGRELGNAFSELNDPIDQKERFEAQVREREEGHGEGGYIDHDYIRALEYGMPPAGGMGIGVDRLVMLLTNKHTIRDTILFPLLRPENPGASASEE